jgi:hypothetical protein
MYIFFKASQPDRHVKRQTDVVFISVIAINGERQNNKN